MKKIRIQFFKDFGFAFVANRWNIFIICGFFCISYNIAIDKYKPKK